MAIFMSWVFAPLEPAEEVSNPSPLAQNSKEHRVCSMTVRPCLLYTSPSPRDENGYLV